MAAFQTKSYLGMTLSVGVALLETGPNDGANCRVVHVGWGQVAGFSLFSSRQIPLPIHYS